MQVIKGTINHQVMQRKYWIKLGFALFLFLVGFLIGAGFSKTLRQLERNTTLKQADFFTKPVPAAAVSWPSTG